jgi:hypothetical protein
MKKVVTKKRLTVFFALAIIAGVAYQLEKKLFCVQEYHFFLDPHLSNGMRTKIERALTETDGSFSAIAQTVFEICPALETIAIERLANNVQYFSCKAAQPAVSFESKSALLPSGIVVDADCYTREVIAQIPSIHAQKEGACDTISPELAHWLLALNPDVFKQYHIALGDDYSIYLTNNNDRNRIILTSVVKDFDDEMRRVCERIISEKQMSVQGTARSLCCVADIRFEKQIVLCSQKGGARNG